MIATGSAISYNQAPVQPLSMRYSQAEGSRVHWPAKTSQQKRNPEYRQRCNVSNLYSHPRYLIPTNQELRIMALAEDTVREALKQVIDPELYVNIVDLGLIYVVNISEEDDEGKHEVNIEMTMTSPMCPAGPQLVAGTKGAAEGLDEVSTCEVKVVMEPAWSPDLMTDEARDHLGIF